MHTHSFSLQCTAVLCKYTAAEMICATGAADQNALWDAAIS